MVLSLSLIARGMNIFLFVLRANDSIAIPARNFCGARLGCGWMKFSRVGSLPVKILLRNVFSQPSFCSLPLTQNRNLREELCESL
jgi:hypothetical protein